MRYRHQLLGFLTVLGFWGCLTPVYEWKKDGATAMDQRRDKASCEYDSEVANGSPYSLNAEQKEARKSRVKKMIALCMTSRGYKLEQVPIEP